MQGDKVCMSNTEIVCALLRNAEREIAYWRACAERRGKREQALLQQLKRVREEKNEDTRDSERRQKLTKDNEWVLDAYAATHNWGNIRVE